MPEVSAGVCFRMRCVSLYGHMKLQMQIFLKVHDDPSNVPVDGPTQWSCKEQLIALFYQARKIMEKSLDDYALLLKTDDFDGSKWSFCPDDQHLVLKYLWGKITFSQLPLTEVVREIVMPGNSAPFPFDIPPGFFRHGPNKTSAFFFVFTGPEPLGEADWLVRDGDNFWRPIVGYPVMPLPTMGSGPHNPVGFVRDWAFYHVALPGTPAIPNDLYEMREYRVNPVLIPDERRIPYVQLMVDRLRIIEIKNRDPHLRVSQAGRSVPPSGLYDVGDGITVLPADAPIGAFKPPSQIQNQIDQPPINQPVRQRRRRRVD
ncbi:uncharacterized protein [Malus domestica]|uniref:uncharacterized protein isoform X2 n=1 Tax=Malus domestica TaxID=3750 RepID=UPI0010A99CB5|nr:uncharacterized protein LOC103451847 isoform X2 [Malus domestica]XP_028947230.1 uncharacterized protein LOC103451847 isoform X2 [Malus domestica]